MDSHTVYWALLASAIVTAVIRTVPVLFLAHRAFPAIFRDWLAFIPSAILTAIIATEMVARPQQTNFGISIALIAMGISLIAGLISRSLIITVIASILAYFILQLGFSG